MALTKITPQMFDTSAAGHDFNIDNGTFVVDASANRVGIGTATPSTLLDVNGVLTATSIAGTLTTAAQTNITSVGTLSSLTVSGAATSTDFRSTGIQYFTHATDVRFRTTTGAERMRIDSSGNVGIETTTPDEFGVGSSYRYLAVGGSTIPGIINLVDNGTSGSYLQFGTAAGLRRASIHAVNGSHLAITVNGSNSGTSLTEAVRIKNNGNVGIGAQNPGYPLEVQSGGVGTVFRAGTSFFSVDATGSASSPSLVFNGDTDTGFYRSAGDTIKFASAGVDRLTLGSSFTCAVGATFNTTTTVGGTLKVDGSAGFLQVDVGGTMAARVGSTNDIVGGTDNDAVFQTRTGAEMFFYSGSSPSMHIKNGGDVKINSGRLGIGMDAVQALDIDRTAGLSLRFYQSGTFRAGIQAVTGAGQMVGTSAANDFGIRSQSNMLFASGGNTERMRIKSDGNVGIGNSNPTAKLQITDENAGQAMLQIRNYATSATGSFANTHSVELRSATSTTTHGLLVAHYESDQSRRALDIANNAGIFATFNTAGHFLMGKTSTNFDNAGVEIRATGEVIITRANDLLHLNRISSDGTIVTFRRGATSTVGSIGVSTTATTYNTTSDRRLKENIIDASSASEDIDAIQVRSFDWKANGSHQKYGMIAQELLPVAPNAVSQPEDSEKMMSIDYSKLVPMLVKEIQSLRTRVRQLEEEK